MSRPGGRSRGRQGQETVVQGRFPFLERRERHERAFRRSILAAAALAVVGLLAGLPAGREAVRRTVSSALALARWPLGLPTPRGEIEADRAARRRRDVASASATFRQVCDEATPPVRRLLHDAGMDAQSALLRWGNYDKILVLPSAVFAPDDTGRSYRLRPNLRSVWLRGVDLSHGMNGFFLVPDTPELPAAMAGTQAMILRGSEQTTNSWGCRGPEPDLSAPLRGIVLGDSTMQGYFIGDAETPPVFIGLEIESRLGTRTSILNTGCLGYSPEQYYYTLIEYAERFRPQFVVVTLCVNDFGDVADAIEGRGDWAEAKHWLDAIADYCRKQGIMVVTAPVPYDLQITGYRRSGNFPGKADNLSRWNSFFTCFPIEDLIDEWLRLRAANPRSGPNPLYNLHLDDHHFTPRGSEVWGRAVGRRIALLFGLMRGRAAGP